MKKSINLRFWQSTPVAAALILLAATVWKVILVVADRIPFNGDESVVALMARHIAHGQWMVFMYGQAYMGSLDASLIALGFWIFGEHVWVIRMVQILLYLLILTTTILLGKEAFNKWSVGLLAAALLAIPPVNVTLYTTATQGGYGETLLIGNLLFLLALKNVKSYHPAMLCLWGFLAGLGFWADGLTMVYSVPAAIYLLLAFLRQRAGVKMVLSRLAVIAGGALLGLLPVWVYIIQNGLQPLIHDLTGSAMNVEEAGWLGRVGMHLLNLLLLGLPAAWGLRPPWQVEWLVLPLLPFLLIFWVGVLVFFIRKALQPGGERAAYALLAGAPLSIILGFLFTSFGVDPSGRYFVPMAVPLAFAAVGMITSLDRLGRWRWALFALVVVYQLAGNIQVALEYPPGLTTQIDRETIIDHRFDAALIAFLEKKGETRGYANYWVAYPLAFLSGEKLIYTPRLPYHSDLRFTERDVRYKPHDEMVAASSSTAYISTARTPLLDDALKLGFEHLGVTWQEAVIGDYHVYYGLSRAVSPQELGLGRNAP